MPKDWKLVILVDRDNQDCMELKHLLEKIVAENRLVTRSAARTAKHSQVLNRILVEELEAWFFGDVAAIVEAYPGVPTTLAQRRGFRNPDAISGGTWEALERVLQQAGYYATGMPKIEVARKIAEKMWPDRNQSHSFQVFRAALQEMVS